MQYNILGLSKKKGKFLLDDSTTINLWSFNLSRFKYI